MRKLIAISAFAIAAAAAPAVPVPLVIRATGYTELLKPQSIDYIAAAGAVTDDPATADVDETAAAVPASFVIRCTYRLGYKTPVVDMDIEGVGVKIAPHSAPEFMLLLTVPEEVFDSYYTGDVAALALVLQGAGPVNPNAELISVIRDVAFDLLGPQPGSPVDREL